jgi:hypothetical protein
VLGGEHPVQGQQLRGGTGHQLGQLVGVVLGVLLQGQELVGVRGGLAGVVLGVQGDDGVDLVATVGADLQDYLSSCARKQGSPHYRLLTGPAASHPPPWTCEQT